MAIISGLNVSAVTRLKSTWEAVESKHKEKLKQLEELVSPNSNYRNYRLHMEGFEMVRQDQKEPCIPFFGLHLKDLLFINDGNPKFLENGFVNFSKMKTIYEKVARLKSYTTISYPASSNPGADVASEYIKNPRSLKEPALYKYSCLCEAKGGESGRLLDKVRLHRRVKGDRKTLSCLLFLS